MAFDDAQELHELFSEFGPITVRRMFSGKGLYSNGVHFGLVMNGVVFLRADEETIPMFQAEGSRPFVYETKLRTVTVNYWTIPERCYDEPEALVPFAREAVAAAQRIAAKKTRPRKAKKIAVKSQKKPVKNKKKPKRG